jgi:hypothetical protein
MRCCGREVNWSAIAGKAFADEIGRREAERGDADIEDVIARLHGTQRPSRGALFEQGRAHGENWARHEATAHQLQRLGAARWRAKTSPGYHAESWLAGADDKRPAAEVLASLIGDEKQSFVGTDHAKLMESSEYVHGFAAGAIHIWKLVARRLRSGF